jgi:hypothetical protein
MKLPKIRKYHVWIPNKRSVETDNIDYANKTAILANGTVYEDIRHNGKRRLQKAYYRLKQLNKLPEQIDYPYLLN